MKKFNVRLDPEKVERLREVARRRAVLVGRDVNWVMLLRDAADRILADEDQGRQSVSAANRSKAIGGVR